MRNIIIYGAGQRAELALNGMRRQYPDAKIVFCDSDINKIGNYVHNIPILSRDKAKMLLNMPGGGVYISSDKYHKEIQDDLILSGFCPEEKIINNYKNKQPYWSCYSLEGSMIIDNFGLLYCCPLIGIRHNPACIPWEKTQDNKIDIKKTLNKFFIYREKLIRDNNNPNIKGFCKDCPDLQYKFWEHNDNVEVIAFSPYYPCQLSCQYCDFPTNRKNTDLELFNKAVQLAETIEFDVILTTLKENKRLMINEPIQIAGGEITVSPYREKLYAILKDYPAHIFTNAIIYDSDISKLVSRPGSILNISLDSGTANTYKIVKGLDVFDRVTNNIRRYKKEGANIILKYILLYNNMEENDLNSFLLFVKEIKPMKVIISRDVMISISKMNPREIVSAKYLINELKKINIKYEIADYFGDKLITRK